MSKCIFYTHAYNAEATLERAIRSVLGQTDPELVYYILDNGSDDRTGELIRAAAARDSRVIPLRNKKNYVFEPGNAWPDIVETRADHDLFCFLDADDEYKPDFLEKTRSFMRTNGLDMAACGNDYLDSNSGQITGSRELPMDVVISGEGFSDGFPCYHGFMRTMWGKLYTVALLKRFDHARASRTETARYGGDTLFTLENLRNACRAGILRGTLHRYYLSPKSMSYRLDSSRGKACATLHEFACQYLLDKCGRITPRNREFLLAVFLNDLYDILRIALSAKTDIKQSVAVVLDALVSGAGRELLACPALRELDTEDGAQYQKMRQEAFSSLISWMLSLDEVPDELAERFCWLGTMLSAAMDDQNSWVSFQLLQLQFFREQGRNEEARALEAELSPLGIV